MAYYEMGAGVRRIDFECRFHVIAFLAVKFLDIKIDGGRSRKDSGISPRALH
jgi:hypothetical protein